MVPISVLKSYTGLFRNGFLGLWWFTSFSDFVIKTFHSSSLPILSKKRGTWYLAIEMIRQEKVPLGFFKINYLICHSVIIPRPILTLRQPLGWLKDIPSLHRSRYLCFYSFDAPESTTLVKGYQKNQGINPAVFFVDSPRMYLWCNANDVILEDNMFFKNEILPCLNKSSS